MSLTQYTEPSNFALVTLFQHGVLHRICEEPKAAAQRSFVLLMAHLFNRRQLSKIYTNKNNIEELRKRYPSIIILPELPDSVSKVLTSHNEEILKIFVGYAMTYAAEYAHALGPDTSLPLSGKNYSSDPTMDPIPAFLTHLKETATSVTARSLFVASSGHDDNFSSVRELARTARSGLHLNENAIPSFDHLISDERSGRSEHALNAYLLDFYMHGQVQSVVAANGIRRGDVWYLLQDFSMTLMTVKTALEQLLMKASKDAQHATKASKEATPAGPLSVDLEDIDSGYGTFDPSEEDRDDDNDEVDDEEASGGFKRPSGVTERDWRVYEVVEAAASEFGAKFRAMWA